MLFLKRHLLNESQKHDMYCLWFIPVIVVATILMMLLGQGMPTFVPMSSIGSVAYEKMFYVQYLFSIFCFKYIPNINNPEEYRRKAEYALTWC